MGVENEQRSVSPGPQGQLRRVHRSSASEFNPDGRGITPLSISFDVSSEMNPRALSDRETHRCSRARTSRDIWNSRISMPRHHAAMRNRCTARGGWERVGAATESDLRSRRDQILHVKLVISFVPIRKLVSAPAEIAAAIVSDLDPQLVPLLPR